MTSYTNKQQEYLDLVGNDAHQSAMNIIADLENQLEDADRRIDQLGVNCKFLMDKMDVVHKAICPRQYGGTWQQRAEQCAEFATRHGSDKKISKPDKRKIDPKERKFRITLYCFERGVCR